MKAQKSLAHQFGLVYQATEHNLRGMTPEQSLARPARGGNCANWILGHLTNMQNMVMQLIGEPPVWESGQLRHAGFYPITDPGEAIEWDTLRVRFLGSRERCLTAISRLTDERLAETVPHPFGGTCSRAELLGTLAIHQSYHAGQLGLARRVAGMEGVIKGPGQVLRV